MQIALLSPQPPAPGGGALFNAGLLPALRARGHAVTDGDGPGTPVIDGMVLPGLEPGWDALLARDPVVIVHHLSAAAGRDASARAAVAEAERRMLHRVRRVVATSQPVADRLRAEFGVPHPTVLHPGWPRLPRTEPGPGGGPCRLLSPGVLTPRKGHGRLLAALARLTDLPWTLVIAGDPDRDPAHAADLRATAERLGLSPRTRFTAVPAWSEADLVVSATAWEGFPAALMEALRRGLPAVAPRLPGIEPLLPAAAAILYPPDDAATFGKCLRRAIFDSPLRSELAQAAWTAGQALPDWDTQAAALEALLRS